MSSSVSTCNSEHDKNDISNNASQYYSVVLKMFLSEKINSYFESYYMFCSNGQHDYLSNLRDKYIVTLKL